MNNVEKAMDLALQYAGDYADFIYPGSPLQKHVMAENKLRTHLEAMEADRGRLLEALKSTVDILEDGHWQETKQHLRSIIAQSEAQSGERQ